MMELENVEFLMKAIKYHRSAFERKIQLNRSHRILNSKYEYNRCALPRLGLKLGERDCKEKETVKRKRKSRKKVTNLKTRSKQLERK
jgi:hypothetical protein